MSRALSFAFLLLFVLAAVPPADAALAELKGKLDVPPPAPGKAAGLIGPAAIYSNGASYIFGGRMSDGATFSDKIYKWDHATGVTTAVATLPVPAGAIGAGRYEGAVAALGGKIYHFGGAAQVPVVLRPGEQPKPIPTSIKDIVEFDPTQPVADGSNPKRVPAELNRSMWGLTAITYGDTIYLFGGFSFNIPTSEYGRWPLVQTFTVSKNPLTQQNEYRLSVLDTRLPFNVSDMSIAAIDKRIYVMGGIADNNTANPCPTFQYYNQSSEEYETRRPTTCETDAIIAFDPIEQRVKGITARLPYRPQWSVGAAVRGKAYVMGGKLPNNAASSTIVEFDPTNLAQPTRVLTPTLPVGMIAPGISSDGETIHLFGGRSDPLSSASVNVTLVDPRPTPPWAPRSPAVQKLQGAVRLSWDPPAYNGDSSITAYRVYRSVDGEESLLKETTDLTYTDSTIKPNLEYLYRLTAVNAVGESRTSARASLTSEPVPPGPVSVFEVFGGNSEALLRWSAPTDDGGSNLTGYRVYRNGTELPYASPPPSQFELRDTAVQNGVTYEYTIRAANAKGEGASSPVVSVTPKAVPPAPFLASVALDGANVRVTWEPPAVAVSFFVVWRGTDPARLLSVANVSAELKTFSDTTAERGRTYYYAVAATNDIGSSPPSNVQSVSLVSKPAPPINLIAAPGMGEIKLTWQPPTDAGEADPATLTYAVQRDGRLIATDIKAVTYTDRSVLPGRNYTYAVLSFNGIQSDPSATARAAARAVENQAPVAVLAVLSSIALPGDPVEFDASQSSDADGTLTRYRWDFGDGSLAVETTTANVTHQFTDNGTYTVTLTVMDNRNVESAPSEASVQIGQIAPGDRRDTGEPEIPTPTEDRPGSGTPRIPGPPMPAVLAMVVVVALVARRLHSRK